MRKMKGNRKKAELRPGYISAIIVLILAAVIAMILLTDANRDRREANIVLPETGEGLSPSGSVELPREAPEPGKNVEIDTGNVLSVIRAMDRPEQYYLEMDSTVYADGSSLTAHICHCVRGEQSVTRRIRDGDRTARYLLRSGDTIRIWYEGGQDVYSGSVEDYSGDDAAGVPTYEEVLTSADRILSAKYVMEDGRACIYVLTQDEALSYSRGYFIDVDTGLLVKSQTQKNGTLVYEMCVTVYSEDISSMENLLDM